MLFEPCHRYHILKGIIQRLQVWVNLVAHVTWKKTEFLTCLHCRTAKYNLPYLTVLQCFYCKCDCRVSLSCSCRAHGKNHIVLLEFLDKPALVLGAWVYRASVDVVDNDIAVAAFVTLLAVYCINYCLFVQTVVFVAILLEQVEHLVEPLKFLLVTHSTYYIVACHNAQFGMQSLEHLQVYVPGTVESYKVNTVKNKIPLYHPAFSTSLLLFLLDLGIESACCFTATAACAWSGYTSAWA